MLEVEVDWSQAPAWVQAVGSILAIGVAIFVGKQSDARSHQLVHDERWRQATIVAATFAMRMSVLRGEALAKHAAGKAYLQMIPAVVTAIRDPADMASAFCIGEERNSESFRAQLLLLDSQSGVMAVTALDTLESHNLSCRMMFRNLSNNGPTHDSLRDLITDRLESISSVASILQEVEQQLAAVHGFKPLDAGPDAPASTHA